VAFANNDMAVVARTFGGKLTGCLGFAIYRIDVRAGTETCLPTLATFAGQDATPSRTTAGDPGQKFFWKDTCAKRSGPRRRQSGRRPARGRSSAKARCNTGEPRPEAGA